jgi:hypothetical protein
MIGMNDVHCMLDKKEFHVKNVSEKNRVGEANQ